MTDLKNGIIDYQGVIVSKDTKVSDFDNLSSDEVDIQVSKHGGTLITALKPITANGIDMQLEIFFSEYDKYPDVKLYPSIPSGMTDWESQAKYSLDSSKKWLAAMINEQPTSIYEDSVEYSYKWGSLSAMCYMSRDYGLDGGELIIRYKES